MIRVIRSDQDQCDKYHFKFVALGLESESERESESVPVLRGFSWWSMSAPHMFSLTLTVLVKEDKKVDFRTGSVK